MPGDGRSLANEGASGDISYNFERAHGPPATSQQYLILHQLASKYYADCEIIDIMTCVFQSPLSINNMIYCADTGPTLELETKVKRMFTNISQSWRRPLLLLVESAY